LIARHGAGPVPGALQRVVVVSFLTQRFGWLVQKGLKAS
jgi:hypothetical protein